MNTDLEKNNNSYNNNNSRKRYLEEPDQENNNTNLGGTQSTNQDTNQQTKHTNNQPTTIQDNNQDYKQLTNSENMDYDKEINELKSLVKRQSKKIRLLEKKSHKIQSNTNKMDETIDELYDIVNSLSEDVYTEMDKKEKYSNRNYSDGSDMDSDDPDYFPRQEYNKNDAIYNFEKKLNDAIRTYNTRSGTQTNKQSTSQNNNSGKSKIGKHIRFESESENNSDSEISDGYNDDKEQLGLSTPIAIPLNKEQISKIKMGEADEQLLKSIIKKAIIKADPVSFVDKYCKDLGYSKSKKTKLINQTKQYLKLSENTNTEISELEHFIETPENTRKEIIKSLEYINENNNNDKPYKFRILSSQMDNYAKNIALYKANQLEDSEPGTGDYYKLKNWLDTLLDIPWGMNKYINVNNAMVGSYLKNARECMNKVIYGQDETKDVIIQIISKMITNPQKSGNVFAVYGPPGVGKTTIIKEGMSRALNIPFAFISLGGATDASYLDGHGYTYEGSVPGKIVDLLKKVKCMNPIFYFDELDKVSDTRKGEEIANLLIHLTDPSQNSMFQDKYLGNVNLDLSQSIFVFSFNDITRVNPILLDRMELIYVKGFTLQEKLKITRDYLLPELMDLYRLYSNNTETNLAQKNIEKSAKSVDVIFTDEVLEFIINYGGQTKKEDGVRQIKRRLEKICSQLNILKITGEDCQNIHSILDSIPELKTGNIWPLTLDNKIVDKLLKIKSREDLAPPFGMYC